MYSRLEALIEKLYKQWKSGRLRKEDAHPDEETLACFAEGKLSVSQTERVKAHLVNCDICSEAVALNIKLESAHEAKEVPCDLSTRLKEKLFAEEQTSWLEIILLLKDKTMEIINITGDVLVGQELMPAPILRSRSIKEFKDEITILKDFGEISVEARIENKTQGAFNVVVAAKAKDTQKLIKDIRVSLLKDDVELESYLASSGSVIFEHILAGKYKVEISGINEKLASILLDIRV